MKAIILGGFLLAGTCLCFGQSIRPVAPEKGAYSVGFSLQYFKSQHSDSITLFQVTPGYFVTDNLEVRLPFAVDRGFNADEIVYGLGLRWHFGHKGRLFDPFVGGIYEHATAQGGFKEDFFGGVIGANYFVANNVAVQGILQIGSDRTRLPDESSTSLGFGFVVFFSGK
ncbi:MAG TPA: hypothetical protein VHE55_01725 [Fimbriimonadaceae bacterium]|nr:hypothetical protein [Fimbriimonadaceae bacterium]